MADSPLDPSRRQFLEGLTRLGTGMLVAGAAGEASAQTPAAPAPAPAPAAASKPRLRYAIVGTGSRGSSMWGREVRDGYSDVVEFVGLCDPNPKRAEAARELIGVDCPTYTDFDRMCKEARPDLVAVTTVDTHHAEYVIRALDRGLRVMTEKPMVVDEKQCQAVLDAEKRNGRPLVVTFNYRFSPRHDRIKQILASGELGKVVAVAFDWYLDTEHGADYFRRWHRLRKNSGTLLVHKASHHFDLINWWLDADPVEVSAKGRLARYGANGPFRSSHCRPCAHKSRCDFHFDVMKDPRLVKLYVEPESVDGYHRDGCLFQKDVDIYDSMTALVTYSNGVAMNYSLNAFMPFEGYNLLFTCEKGTLAARLVERVPGGDKVELTITKTFDKQPPVVERPVSSAGHGGGDQRLRDLIFRGGQPAAHLGLPGSRAGAFACLTGIAARKSIEQKTSIRIDQLVRV